MTGSGKSEGPNPTRWHFVVAFAPIVLALAALGGLLWFHCGNT